MCLHSNLLMASRQLMVDSNGRNSSVEVGELSSFENGTDGVATRTGVAPESSETVSPQVKDGLDESWVSVEFENTTGIKENVEVMIVPENEDLLDPFSNIATIMVAGRPRFGKSTALNNIFGLDFVTAARPTSVTQVVSDRHVTKEIHTAQKNGPDLIEKITLRVIDTPGLGALDIPQERIIKEMTEMVKSDNFTLLYCFNVAQNNCITEMDISIIRNLHAALGAGIWSKSVILFTFSDFALTAFDYADEYRDYINAHAEQFEKMLKASGCSNPPNIRTIFQSPLVTDKNENTPEIVAIPTRRTLKKSDEILPGILKENEDWTDVVFFELMKKTSKREIGKFFAFKYSNLVIGMGSASFSVIVATTIGAVVGGPVGAIIGGLAGGAVGVTVPGIWSLVKAMKNKKGQT